MNARKQPTDDELAQFDQQTLDNFANLDREDQRAMIRIYENAKGNRLWTAEGRNVSITLRQPPVEISVALVLIVA